MAEDIFKEFTPKEIAAAYEELCDELCETTGNGVTGAGDEPFCCDDEANDLDKSNKDKDKDGKDLANAPAPPAEDGAARADSIIACMSSVESQMSSMVENSNKMQDLISLRYDIEELYYHYLVLGQYYEGKHVFVKYMQDALSLGGTSASDANDRFNTALGYTQNTGPFSVLRNDNPSAVALKNYTDQGVFVYSSSNVRLELRLRNGITQDAMLPRTLRNYQEDNEILAFRNEGRQNNGLLYTNYLDAAAHLDDVFTLQERGLSMDTPDPTLAGTGAEGYMDKYVGDLAKFNDFHSNFKKIFESKMSDVRASLPQSAAAAGEYLRRQAEHEAALMIQSNGYATALAWSIKEGLYYNDKIDQIKRDVDFVYSEIKNTEDTLMSSGEAVTKITCLGAAGPDLPHNAPIFDGDDSGKGAGLGFANTIDYPNMTEMAYWRRFATIATLVGVLPLPGPGLFRYWPIGIILPPAIRLPLPIIWIPIKAIATPFGVFVFFIGLSGIFPSPFLFYVSPTGQKSFLLSVTPTLPFGIDSSSPPTKPMSAGGISVPVPIFREPEISSKDSTTNMVESFTGKVTERIAIKQSDLDAYNAAEDKSAVIKDIVSKSMEGSDFAWTYPAGSSKTNPKKSDAQTLKDTKSGDAKSALAGLSILGKLVKLQAPKLPFGADQSPVKVDAAQLLPVLTSNMSISSDALPITTTDLKTLIVDSVQSASSEVVSHFNPVLAIADGLQDISPKTIPEALKFPKLSFSTKTVSGIDPKLLEIANKAVAALSLIPYPAVAFAPQVFNKLHPILSNDDIPPWERLSLKNFLFVAFLDNFCKTGKLGSIMPV